MYCPQCLAEFEDCVTECSDCGVRLVPGSPPQPAKDPESQFVTVMETSDALALSLAKSSLEEARVEYLLIGDPFSYHSMVHSISEIGSLTCCCRIQVAPEDEKEARALLEPFQNPESAA